MNSIKIYDAKKKNRVCREWDAGMVGFVSKGA